jgi:hypothetical protein
MKNKQGEKKRKKKEEIAFVGEIRGTLTGKFRKVYMCY